jgi:hypothetical protein
MKPQFVRGSIVLGTLLLTVSLAGSFAHSDDNWQKKHPRRAEVNGRLKNQQKRTDQGLANGSLKSGQAQKIQNQDAHIKQQEKNDAAANGGHITKAQQNQLNHEENGVSHEINHDEQKNTAQPPAAPAQ